MSCKFDTRPMSRVKGKYNVIEATSDTFGMIEVATSEDNYFKCYDLAVDSESFQFKVLRKHQECNEQIWLDKGVDCQVVLNGDKLVAIIPNFK